MCGIAGISGDVNPSFVREQLRLMTDAMSHRGPDDRHIVTVDRPGATTGLGTARLAIQDCSDRGRQPMTSSQTGTSVAFNGELYNVRELREELSAKGHRFRGESDTEVVLAAWDEWGEGALERFRGMFGLAVWDARTEHVLLVRDRLGIKPLYYAAADDKLAFASELRPLLLAGVVAPRLSSEGVRSFLRFGHVEEPGTMIEGLRLLESGTILRWSPSRRTLGRRTYWSLASCFPQGPGAPSRERAVGEVRVRLEDAARKHLVSDVPLGVFLSGGIDSSSLVGLVSEVGGEAPRTVSVVFSEEKYSEERYIRAVRDRFGTQHTEVALSGDDLLAELPAALVAMDQPTVDGINTFVVSRAARESGLTVVLSGLGGDELFAGYDTFRFTRRLEGLRRRLPRAGASAVAIAARRRYGDTDRGRKLGRWFDPRCGETSPYLLQRELLSPSEVTGLLPSSQAANRVEPFDPEPTGGDTTNNVSYLELTHYMRNMLLRDSDAMSMAHSLELRVPFLDHLLVEYVTGLPGPLKAEGSSPKPLLVDALSDLLPDEVVNRRKMGFTFPLESWLRGPLRETVKERLSDDQYGGAVSELLDGEAVDAVWQRFVERRTSWSRPWALYVLKSWAELNLDGTVAAASS